MSGLGTAFGSGAMTNSIQDLGLARAFLVIGSNTTEQHPVIALQIKRAVRKGARLIVADPRAIELAELADVHLSHQPGTDLGLLNGLAQAILEEGRWDRDFVARRTENFDAFRASVAPYTPEFVERLTGVPAEKIRQAARLYATSRPAAIVYAMGITQHVAGHRNVLALANLAMLTGNVGMEGSGVNPLRGQNNVQGACDMGALPDVYTGYQKVVNPEARAKFEEAWGVPLPAEPGLTVVEMTRAAAEGKVKAMYVVGENPMLSDPDLHHVREALESLDFLVVQDIFLTETAQLADVVLPGASFAEKDGTYTNTERRVQLIRKAVEPPGQARPDWWVVAELAERVQRDQGPVNFHYDSPAQIMEEIASLTPAYGGIRHERLGIQGLQWPCPTTDHPGTPVLHRERFTRGLGIFTPVEFMPADELPDGEYPFILTTGRLLQHYHTGSMTRRVPGLNQLVPQELMEINPVDATRLGLQDGAPARVRSRRGEVLTRVRVTDRPRLGVVFMTFHFAEAAANLLTNPALDPTAKIPEFKACAVRVEPA